MNLIDFSRNEDNIAKQAHIESVLLYGNPEAVPDAKITICIPTYKRPSFLKKAIESAVDQNTNIPYRIIVVDNDPDLNNMEILSIMQSFNRDNISYYKNKENLMTCGNLNRCVVLSKTPWVALLHDDDLLLNNYISVISKILLKKGDKIAGLSNKFEMLDYPFATPVQQSKIYIFFKKIYRCLQRMCSLFTGNIIKVPLSANLFLGNIYMAPTCGMVFKTNTFIESGGFDQTCASDDWFFCIYYAERYNFYRIRAPVSAIYRWAVNGTLKDGVLEKFILDRERCFESLKEYSLICRFWMNLFKKDFNVLKDSMHLSSAKTTILYKLVRRIYDLFIQ